MPVFKMAMNYVNVSMEKVRASDLVISAFDTTLKSQPTQRWISQYQTVLDFLVNVERIDDYMDQHYHNCLQYNLWKINTKTASLALVHYAAAMEYIYDAVVMSEDVWVSSPDKQIFDPMDIILYMDEGSLPSYIPVKAWTKQKPGLVFNEKYRNMSWKNQQRHEWLIKQGKHMTNREDIDWSKIDKLFKWDDGDQKAPEQETAQERQERQYDEVMNHYWYKYHFSNIEPGQERSLLQKIKHIFKTNLFVSLVENAPDICWYNFTCNLTSAEACSLYGTITLQEHFWFDNQQGL